MGLRSTSLSQNKTNEAFVIQGTAAGIIEESRFGDASRRSKESTSYWWMTNNTLVLDNVSWMLLPVHWNVQQSSQGFP